MNDDDKLKNLLGEAINNVQKEKIKKVTSKITCPIITKLTRAKMSGKFLTDEGSRALSYYFNEVNRREDFINFCESTFNSYLTKDAVELIRIALIEILKTGFDIGYNFRDYYIEKQLEIPNEEVEKR